MKKDIHPKYGSATVTCGCGNSWETRSTQKEIRVEVCSKCHPFYTGSQKFLDTAGRVEKFQRKYGWSEEGAATHAETGGKKAPKKKAKARKKRPETPKVDLRPKVIKRPAKPKAEAGEERPKVTKPAPAEAPPAAGDAGPPGDDSAPKES